MKITALRSSYNPLITFDSDPSLGRNINGPSVIKVPTWVEKPLGKYYMYFGHHNGDKIRLAFANNINGPWSIHKPGTLQLKEVPIFKSHIASPDVHIDEVNKEIIMYFHGPSVSQSGQWTAVATSKNGIDFKASDQLLGAFYFRVFKYREYFYAIAKAGNGGWGRLYRSKDGKTPFEDGGDFMENVRHTAIAIKENYLYIYYSRKGDAPERILLSIVDLTKDWKNWQLSTPIEVIKPELDYEGLIYENIPSRYGAAIEVQQLRDPCIYEEAGKTYLFYSYAGEMGISMAELKIQSDIY